MPGGPADPAGLSLGAPNRAAEAGPSRVRRSRLSPLLRALAGVAILVTLGIHLGAAPFLAGLHAVGFWSVCAALLIGLATTVCSAWRWSLVARGLGLRLPVREAVVECYRALFLNSVLPAGVLGDVDRAVRHGRRTGALGRCARAVVVERVAGQVVLIAVAGVVLVPRLVHDPRPWVAAVLVGVAVLATVAVRRIRPQPGGRRIWPGVALLSAAAVAGYLTVFLIAARAAGSTAPVGDLLPVLVLALLAMGLPVNIGGWGPREAATAAGFGMVGLGAAQGLTAAVVYGVLSFIACLPGLVVLLLRRTGVRRPPELRPVTHVHRSVGTDSVIRAVT